MGVSSMSLHQPEATIMILVQQIKKTFIAMGRFNIMKTGRFLPEITCNAIISRILEGCVFGLVG